MRALPFWLFLAAAYGTGALSVRARVAIVAGLAVGIVAAASCFHIAYEIPGIENVTSQKEWQGAMATIGLVALRIAAIVATFMLFFVAGRWVAQRVRSKSPV